jgi:hypothetical protein
MTAPASPARWLRAGALAGSSVGLAGTGHAFGGGHVDVVFLALVVTATTVGAYHWVARERGLPAIVAVVVLLQVCLHALFGVGHAEGAAPVSMVVAHAVAAILLAVFLRWGEARLHAAARRRYLQWAVAVRLALAGRPRPLPLRPRITWPARTLRTVWTSGTPAGRGPPAAACC